MTGKTHTAIGIAAALTMAINKPPEEILVLVLAASLGSLVPDLDHPKAKLNQILLKKNNNFYKTFFFIGISGAFMYLYFLKNANAFWVLSLITFLFGVSTHRGFTHSIVGFLSIMAIMKIYKLDLTFPNIYHGFSIGYVLHLVADFFTPMGIKLFYPLNKYISSPITFKTNGKFEKIIFMGISFYSVFLLLRYGM